MGSVGIEFGKQCILAMASRKECTFMQALNVKCIVVFFRLRGRSYVSVESSFMHAQSAAEDHSLGGFVLRYHHLAAGILWMTLFLYREIMRAMQRNLR